MGGAIGPAQSVSHRRRLSLEIRRRQGERCWAGDQYHVIRYSPHRRLRIMSEQLRAGRLTKTAASPVAPHGALQLPAHSHSDPPLASGTRAGEGDQGHAGIDARAFDHPLKVALAAQPEAPLHRPIARRPTGPAKASDECDPFGAAGAGCDGRRPSASSSKSRGRAGDSASSAGKSS
jgi:hypothetical protein